MIFHDRSNDSLVMVGDKHLCLFLQIAQCFFHFHQWGTVVDFVVGVVHHDDDDDDDDDAPAVRIVLAIVDAGDDDDGEGIVVVSDLTLVGAQRLSIDYLHNDTVLLGRGGNVRLFRVFALYSISELCWSFQILQDGRSQRK